MITDPPHLGYENKECIYDEDLTSQSSVTISDLDGDADREYLIKIDGASLLSADPYLQSSLADSWVGILATWKTSTAIASGDGVTGGKPKLGAGNAADGSSHKLHITAILTARTGKVRWFECYSKVRYTGYVGGTVNFAEHDDTTTNITSITLNFGGNFTGNVKLYRTLPK